MKHAKLSPSGASRWIACPGSIRLSAKMPDVESAFAAEGTAAHELGERCLLKGTDPADYKGQDVDGFVVDAEMIEAVSVYVGVCRSISGKMAVEQRFHMAWLHKDIFGTADCVVYNEATKTLCVIDLKYGKGIVVDPTWNPQLMIYALGAVAEHRQCETVEMIIVQPRAEGEAVKRWAISKEELLNFALNVVRPAAIRTESADAALEVGPHCRFCKAIAVCPAQAERAVALAKTEFSNPILPDPENMTPDQIAHVIAVAGAFSKWAASVRAYAQSRLEAGTEIPGFKLVARRSNRKWVNAQTAAEFLEERLGDDAFERKILSVAKAEKALKKSSSDPKELESLWFKPEAGAVIAEESDKRKSVGPSVVAEFIDKAEFLK